jgi:MoaA/NifB/PqqE/SkfB family radical SAM enzyme
MTSSENLSGDQGALGNKAQSVPISAPISWKLWLYTNFDCNLWCTYCVAESTPKTPRRELGLENVQRLIDEAVEMGFQRVFFTGGEPFILHNIYDMLAYASGRLDTTVLTNAMLLRGKRLDKLCAIANDNLSVQVSLDGATPEVHDAYRGEGTWRKTVDGIQRLRSNGFHMCISTTETPANTAHIDELCDFVRDLGIAEKDHFVRPLARRGFSQEGLQVGTHNLAPEVTVTADGVYWHPLVSPSDSDMLVTRQIFPLTKAVECIQKQLEIDATAEGDGRTEFQ